MKDLRRERSAARPHRAAGGNRDPGAPQRLGEQRARLAGLAGLCPYFTMFPLRFPLRILARRAAPGEGVLDPFCGRGTTSLAARLLGLPSLAVDASPVAVAISAAKLVGVTAGEIVAEAQAIGAGDGSARVPEGEFWQWAYNPVTLAQLCRLREALVANCRSPARIALRGLVLGALHGPLRRFQASYLSNQCPRTFAPKPGYAVRFWRRRAMRPPRVELLDAVARRARRFFEATLAAAPPARWCLGDSRQGLAVGGVHHGEPFRWVITSPPYYGMRTYVADRWLRGWFLGGP